MQANRENELKKAQARAVLRLMSLQSLIGERLSSPGPAFDLRADAATPLTLLRGLGRPIAAAAPSERDAADVERLYGIGAKVGAEDAGAELASATLVLLPGLTAFGAAEEKLVEDTLEAVADGALLALEIDVSGDAGRAARQLDVVAAILRFTERMPATLIAHDVLHLRYWLVFEKGAGGAARSVRPAADRMVNRWKRLLRGGSALGRAGGAAALAWQVRARPNGFAIAGQRAAAAFKNRRIRQSNARAWQARRRPVIHFGLHTPNNAGDLVLFEAVRATVDIGADSAWVLEHVRKPVGPAMVDQINRSAGIVIGGGGLFLVDNDESSLSGWQWPVSVEFLEKIEAPIAVFAVGYNRFRGQVEFPQAFVDSLTLLVEKSSFMGIRNRGSIAALSGYLPPELAAKLTYQPCATTVMQYLNMPRGSEPAAPQDRRVLAVNAAFDRFGLRLKGRENDALAGIAAMAKRAQSAGWDIVVACHLFDDEAITPFLDQENVSYTVRHFTGVPTSEILSFYESVHLVAGMRGHAQMIPFGVGTPIISLVAHDKMGWFLDDIGHSEWGVDFAKPHARERMIAAFERAAQDLPGRRVEVAAARARLWDITSRNVGLIRGALAQG